MIVMEQKPLDDIIEMLRGYESILILGCDGCAGIYQVGGEKQVEVMASLLRMEKKARENKNLKTKGISILRQCDKEIVSESLGGQMDGCDAILSMACGAGVQTVAEVFPDDIVLPATNTKFIGVQDRENGDLYERCSACGDCILDETGGICPITRCAKGLLNGPCGGCVQGKCEVGGYVNDCAWILIYEKLKKMGRLDLFTKIRLTRDERLSQSPRELKGGIKY